MKITKNDGYFFISLLLAIWFVLTASVWAYWANLIFAYPAGILSLVLWRVGKKNALHPTRYRAIPVVLLVGLALSLATLVYLLIWD